MEQIGKRSLFRLATLFASLMLLGAAVAPRQSIIGIWENPKATVRVRTNACGAYVCGWVVWANAKAADDAREGGTPRLIGTEILLNYKRLDESYWQGQVFVPDMNDRFFSRIRQIDNDQIKVSGCILHGLICKSQLWHRF